MTRVIIAIVVVLTVYLAVRKSSQSWKEPDPSQSDPVYADDWDFRKKLACLIVSVYLGAMGVSYYGVVSLVSHAGYESLVGGIRITSDQMFWGLPAGALSFVCAMIVGHLLFWFLGISDRKGVIVLLEHNDVPSMTLDTSGPTWLGVSCAGLSVALAFFVGAPFARFEDDRIVYQEFFSLNEQSYSYTDVRSILIGDEYENPLRKGTIVSEAAMAIEFRGGSLWTSLNAPGDMSLYEMIKLGTFIASRSDVSVERKKILASEDL